MRRGREALRGTSGGGLTGLQHIRWRGRRYGRGMVRGADALGPTHRGCALWTASLLPLPIPRDLLERLGSRDLHLPALTRPCRAPQGDPVLVAAVDQRVRAATSGIDEGRSRRQVLIDEGLLDGERALRLMDRGRRRVDVRKEGGPRARLFR